MNALKIIYVVVVSASAVLHHCIAIVDVLHGRLLNETSVALCTLWWWWFALVWTRWMLTHDIGTEESLGLVGLWCPLFNALCICSWTGLWSHDTSDHIFFWLHKYFLYANLSFSYQISSPGFQKILIDWSNDYHLFFMFLLRLSKEMPCVRSYV